MARPKGSKNKAPTKKAASGNGAAPERTAPRQQAAATPAPEPKRNQPTPEETAKFLAELTRLKTAAQSIAGDIAALGGRVKSRGGPAYWRALKAQHDLEKMDPEEARAELEAKVTVAAQRGIRISWMGNQATFADIMDQNAPAPKNTEGSRDLAAARAHADGFNSGRQGAVPKDNPFAHAPGSAEYVAWHDGRDDGAKAAAGKNPVAAQRVADAETADHSLPDDGEEGASIADEIATEIAAEDRPSVF